ncbi:helix-turn-helix domain-containing protein [Rhizobium sp. 0TCS1.26]|uniref:helix-turn-helix domain-containing protein n=1 Tax=Rhizobium sp. 0TCS1.26 TaxID=3142623 RepID=UPI003D2D275B
MSRKSRRRNLHSDRLAKINRFYSPDEVQELYGICRNTLGNWVRTGLKHFEKDKRRLFRGDQLNHFHRDRRQRRKSPCGAYEIYCVSCGNKHSLLVGGVTAEHGRQRVRVEMACPEGSGRASKWIKSDAWADIQAEAMHNPDSE